MTDYTEAGPIGELRTERQPSLTSVLWSTLRSVRTTVYVLVAIAAATTVGSLIPQGRPTDYYHIAYGHRWGSILTGLGLDAVYSSTWFIGLLAILLLNLAACAGRSWRRAVARFRGPSAEALARKLQGASAASCWQGTATADSVVSELTRALRRARYTLTVEERRGGCTRVLARRWAWATFGSIITHLAIFLIALGAALGCLPWTSLDKRITIAEGETFHDTHGELGFDVRLEDFRMAYYAATGMPSSYESDLVLLADGEELGKGTATVNAQVAKRGVSLGQSSWGIAGVHVSVQSKDGPETQVVFPVMPSPEGHGGTSWAVEDEGRVAFLADGTAALVANAFVADALEHDGEIVGSASEYPKNPALSLTVVSGFGKGDHAFRDLGWLRADGEVKDGPRTFRLDGIVYNSTLSVRRDPGLPFVWAGFILTTLGMVITFYVRPSTFLIQSDPLPDGRRTRIRVASVGPELAEADRRAIETACGLELSPAVPPADHQGGSGT